MFRRIAVAAMALAVGIAVSAGLVAYSRAAGGARSVFALSRDVPAGAVLTPDAVELVRVALDPAQAAATFGVAEQSQVVGARPRHQLSAGQLLQRSDLEPAGREPAEALVAVPIKDLPPVHAGDRVDLFALLGSGDRFSAQPFAWSVRVAAVTGDGLVLQVQGRRELAFVYAAGTLRLAAVLTTAPVPPAGAVPITSSEQALAAAGD